MAKSRKNRNSIVKNITKTAETALPVVDKSLKKVGETAKNVAKSSVPVIEKGVSAVYGTMATGLDLGVKGARSIARGVSKSRKSRTYKKHSKKGGKTRTRR
jgi:hypothetical protein